MGGSKSLVESISCYLAKRSQQEYRLWQLVVSIIIGAAFELVVIPLLIVVLGRRIDHVMGLNGMMPEPLSVCIGSLFILVGLFWLGWSIVWHHWRGRGTPLPLVPTKVLLMTGPYRYCRNPMALGAFFWLSGWAMLANSPTALFAGVGAFLVLVISYIKLIEEQELERRFGIRYQQYRKQTPFLIPWIRW